MTILKPISQFSVLTFISRLFGLVRDWLFANFFGADGMMDAFLIAFKIPNFFRRLFAEGAFSQVFIPILIGTRSSTDKSLMQTLSSAQRELTSGVSARLYTTVFIFCLFGMLFSPWLISIFAPGFVRDPAQSLLGANLLRITFPYLFFMTVIALLNGLLNMAGRFVIGAILPILLNICFIVSALYLRSLFDPPITILAVALFIAGLLQLSMISVVAYRRGLLIMPRWQISPKNQQKINTMGKLLLTALLSVSITQINLLVDMLLASTLPQGSISWLYYGQRLMELPNGIFIVAISTVVLPVFSYLIQKSTLQEFSPHVDRALLLGATITLPSMIGLILFDQVIISLLFQGGAFAYTDVLQSAKALSAYAVGLPAFMLTKICLPCFFAYQNTKTPLLCSIISVIINIVLSLWLIEFMAHLGLAIATSIATWTNAILLYFFLVKQQKILFFNAGIELLKILAINLLFAFALYQVDVLIVRWQDWEKWQQGMVLSILIGISILVYVLLCFVFRLNIQQWLNWKIHKATLITENESP